MEDKNILEIKNLMVFYENALAINNVSLRCREGEITGGLEKKSSG